MISIGIIILLVVGMVYVVEFLSNVMWRFDNYYPGWEQDEREQRERRSNRSS